MSARFDPSSPAMRASPDVEPGFQHRIHRQAKQNMRTFAQVATPSPVKSGRRPGAGHRQSRPGDHFFRGEEDLVPKTTGDGRVSDAALKRAFGPSPLFGGADDRKLDGETTVVTEQDDEAIAASELEHMKLLSLTDMMSVMRGQTFDREPLASCPPTPILRPPVAPNVEANGLFLPQSLGNLNMDWVNTGLVSPHVRGFEGDRSSVA